MAAAEALTAADALAAWCPTPNPT